MKLELENQLAEKYPFMKKGKPCEDPATPNFITNLYAAFGCQCDDGWYSVIDGLCADIVAEYERAGLPVNIKVEEIKEKFATLRFYYTFEGSDIPSEFKSKIAGIVAQWEHKSESVCEECGAEGKYRGKLDYVLTLCDECYCKKLKK